MGAGIWPGCGCDVRCSKLACKKAGGRSIAPLANQRLVDIGYKYTPERLRNILKSIIEKPIQRRAAEENGIRFSTLKYWLAKSEKGVPGDGFDVEWGGLTQRFHQHYAEALDEGIQQIEDSIITRAREGWVEFLHDRGRVIYQIDPKLSALGLTGADAYLLDDKGQPVPEQITHQDPEIQLEVLRHLRRERWGRRDTHDVRVSGGVMVVERRIKSNKQVDDMERGKLPPLDVDFREVEDDDA